MWKPVLASLDFLAQTTEPSLVNTSNQSFSPEYQSNTTVNQAFTDRSSVEAQVSFIIASIVCFVGVVGNSTTVLYFIVRKKVQIPAFTGIFCSSIANLFALFPRYLIIVLASMVSTMELKYYFYGISAFTHMSSNFHVLIIAIIRYIYVSKPFYSITFRYSKVLYMSLGAWATSFVIAVLYTVHLFLFENNMMSFRQSAVVKIFVACVPFAVSFVPIIILYVLNIVHLRKGMSKLTLSVSKTMSTVLAAIILLFLLANIPGVIMFILHLCDIQTKLDLLGQICWMLDNSSNPFVYVLFSQTTRKSFKNKCTCKYFRRNCD